MSQTTVKLAFVDLEKLYNQLQDAVKRYDAAWYGPKKWYIKYYEIDPLVNLINSLEKEKQKQNGKNG